MQDWETNVQSSIPNTETLNVKTVKKDQRCQPKKYILLV